MIAIDNDAVFRDAMRKAECADMTLKEAEQIISTMRITRRELEALAVCFGDTLNQALSKYIDEPLKQLEKQLEALRSRTEHP